MCGIAGFWTCRHDRDSAATVRMMGDSICHRGPDDCGDWVDESAGIALGHRRLSVIDLSPEGRQPMFSPSGRYVMVFNGEVYNYERLREQLPGVRWRGSSDTEVMLAAFEAWGLEAALQRFIGMFAFALWDRKNRSLSLVRDRLGIKPLYYGCSDGTFVFGSELKALVAHPDFHGSVDRSAVALLLRHGYVPEPYSIFAGVSKLAPGCVLTLCAAAESDTRPRPYWSLRDVVGRGQASPFRGKDGEAVEALRALLQDAVCLRMIADVPLGAFLSGGIDSSLVVAMMQGQSSGQVKTFTVGYDDDAVDESAYASAVARHLGTEHTEITATAADALALVPRIPTLYDEPFADASQIPTLLVSQLTRRHVTVSLSGDGGDELFGGYLRYRKIADWWGKVRRIPRGLRVSFARAVEGISMALPENAYTLVSKGIPLSTAGDPGVGPAGKLVAVLGAADLQSFYVRMNCYWQDPSAAALDAFEPPTNCVGPMPDLPDAYSAMMYLDTLTYLPHDILTKVDRASMSVALEARVPFLDHRVVEFAWTLPLRFKVRGGQQKWLLRRLLEEFVPPELTSRPKMGFSVPLESWLRGPLRDWTEHLLDRRTLRGQGFVRDDLVRRMWDEHCRGRNRANYLWPVLMLTAWYEALAERMSAAASCAASGSRVN